MPNLQTLVAPGLRVPLLHSAKTAKANQELTGSEQVAELGALLDEVICFTNDMQVRQSYYKNNVLDNEVSQRKPPQMHSVKLGTSSQSSKKGPRSAQRAADTL